MHPAAQSHAFSEFSSTVARLSWPVKAVVATAVALTLGFVVGSAAVGPILSDNSADNAAAVKARFERRTVDPERQYPEPHPYRAQSPDFGPHRGPAMGAYARQQAQRELRGRSTTGRALSNEAREAYGSAQSHQVSRSARSHEVSGSARETSGSASSATPYYVLDRHRPQ